MRFAAAAWSVPLIGTFAMLASTYAAAQPQEEATRQLCESEEGRQQILASRDRREVQDVEFQEMGRALSEGRDPDLDYAKKEWVLQLCGLSRPAGDVYPLPVDFSTLPIQDPAQPGLLVARLGEKAWMECNVDYDEDCDMKPQPLAIPEFWDLQACRLEFDVSARGKDKGYEVKEIAPIADEPGLTRRFRGFSIAIWAHGQHTILNQVGAKMRVGNFRFFMVPKAATEAERRRLGCRFYPLPPPPPRPAPKPPTQVPAPTLPQFQEAKGDEDRSYRFFLTNNTDRDVIVEYVVFLSTNPQGERQHGFGRQLIPRRSTWGSNGYHTWDSNPRWRTRYALAAQQPLPAR